MLDFVRGLLYLCDHVISVFEPIYAINYIY